jgi:hypothetical protein
MLLKSRKAAHRIKALSPRIALSHADAPKLRNHRGDAPRVMSPHSVDIANGSRDAAHMCVPSTINGDVMGFAKR